MKYTKEIKVHNAGFVMASVKQGGRECGYAQFTPWGYGLRTSVKATERAAQKAHAWADAWIAMLERQETKE